MIRLNTLFLSIFLTSLCAWSDEINPFNMGNLQDIAPDATIIDARNMSQSSLEESIKIAISQGSKESSSFNKIHENLETNRMGLKVKKFIILNENSTGYQDYSATLMAASYVSNSYSQEADKKKHAQWGYGIGIASTIAIKNSLNGIVSPGVANTLSRTLGALTACAVGAGKEVLYDKGRANHTVDRKDFYATCAGGAGVMIGEIRFTF